MATGRIPTTANSPLTAKGDIFTFSTGSAKLAVGNDGETLVADSSTATGLRYTAGNPISNPVLNSAFQVWQRGTTMSNPSSVATAYGADRWNYFRPSGFTTGITMSRQTTSDTTNLPNIQYCSRIQRTVSNTSTLQLYLAQNFETANSIPYVGKTVTLSYYARAGANYSAASSILTASMVSGTGTDQQVITGLTGQTVAFTSNATLTTTWQRFTLTGSISSTATQIVPVFEYVPVGTAGANDYFEITGVQIDIGSVALPFRTYAGTIQGELAACQRYYYRQTSASNYTYFGGGFAASTTQAKWLAKLPTTMRTSPSFSITNATNLNIGAVASQSVTSITLDQANPDSVGLFANCTAGLVAGQSILIIGNNSSAPFIEYSSEL